MELFWILWGVGVVVLCVCDVRWTARHARDLQRKADSLRPYPLIEPLDYSGPPT